MRAYKRDNVACFFTSALEDFYLILELAIWSVILSDFRKVYNSASIMFVC